MSSPNDFSANLTSPATPATPEPVKPVAPVPPPEEPPCEPQPCVPTEVPITLEIVPVIKLCVDKPTVTLKNNAVCICTPCVEKQPPV